MSEAGTSKKSPKMTEEERLELCHKLDQELDDFINSLERKRYTEGWPEDRWEEEMEKHPFFMKTVPENGEMSPLVEGLAKLKFDPDENTPLELASNYKEDGNFNFKHKNYRLAMMSYTEGIKIKCGNVEMETSLYNNRGASHYHLKNYRSALIDSERALSMCPSHAKSRLRAVKCSYQIAKYESCIEHCERYLEIEPNAAEVRGLLNAAKKQHTLRLRNERRRVREDEMSKQAMNAMKQAIIQRGIKISDCEDESDIDLSKLEPCVPGAHELMVHLVDDVLMWPVLFLYPEVQTSDFIKDCPENVPLIDQVKEVFPAPWDQNNAYATNTVNLYFEGSDKMPHVVDINTPLGDVLKMPYFVLKAGTPAFFILPRGSAVEAGFLKGYM